VDELALRALVGGDDQLMREIIGLFLEEGARLLQQIRDAVAARDADALQGAAHALKGSVGNMAAPRAIELSHAIEVMARNGRLDETPRALTALETELNRVQRALVALNKAA
jgi:HPt (histidine-containing phosphotransfer) domain-containing protein